MYPGQASSSEVQKIRAKQIDSLRQFFPTVKEVTKDQVFEVPIQLPNRSTIKLIINLPPDFPRIPPILQLSPTVQHPLVDSNMYISPAAHDNLSRWAVHVSLGKTVYEIVQKFMKQPPVIGPPLPQKYPNLSTSAYPNPSMIPSQSNPPPNQDYPPQPNYSQSNYSQPNFPPQPNIPSQSALPVSRPSVPATFPELDSKGVNELTLLLNDETEFAKFFENLPSVITSKKLREDLKSSNQELAQKILAKEAEVEKLRQEVAGKNDSIKEKRSTFELKLQRQQEVVKKFSTPALIDKLSEKAQEADEASEALAKQFHSGGMDHKEFIKTYMETRKLYHLRSAKRESMAMLAR